MKSPFWSGFGNSSSAPACLLYQILFPDTGMCSGERSHLSVPQSVWRHLSQMVCTMMRSPVLDQDLINVTLELWASGIQVTHLLRDEIVSSSLGSTPSSIIKASGVLCASTSRLSSPPLSLILWFHWTTCKIQICFSPHGTGRLQTTSPNPLPVGLLQGLVYGIRTWIRRESPTTPKLWAIKC